MNILVTGGAGYIGSHTCIELLAAGHHVIIVDNLVNSKVEAVRRIEEIARKPVRFHEVDLLDRQALEDVFAKAKAAGTPVDAVIHFAALKAVGESVDRPMDYYYNNLTGMLTLCQTMQKFGCQDLVFSSSATVYGDPASSPITEDFPLFAVNPYGRTKLLGEEILRDLHRADPKWNTIMLRYFNPIGAHPSGRIGEDPQGIPNNLLPYVSQVAVGRREYLTVFGDDYPTPDGTCIRDYIHVVDLAMGHVKAVSYLAANPGAIAFNLGTGRPYSVLEVVNAFGEACGRPVPYKIGPRRPGDAVICYADPSLANRELNWAAEFDLQDMCRDTWKWQSLNPNGYE